MRIQNVLIAISLSSWAIAIQAASFDCAKAASTAEKMICDNPALSDLDEQLAKAYKQKLAIDPELTRNEQRVWISEIRNKCVDGGCLYREYRNRINSLKGGADILIAPVLSPIPKPEQDSKISNNVNIPTSSPDNGDTGMVKSTPSVVPTAQLPVKNSSTNPGGQVENVAANGRKLVTDGPPKKSSNASASSVFGGLALLCFALAAFMQPSQPKRDGRFKTGFKNNATVQEKTDFQIQTQRWAIAAGAICSVLWYFLS